MSGLVIRLVIGPVIALAVGLSGLAGCATGDDQGIRNPFAKINLSNPFRRSTEADFQALVRQECSDLGVGTTTVGALMANDQTFQDQTSQLYRGDLSNDEFLNAVLAAHPAADANVPAAGCVVTALQTCLTGPCQPAAAPPTPVQPSADAAALSLGPAGEPAADQMPAAAPPMPEPVMEPVPAPASAPVPASAPDGPPADGSPRPLPWRG